MASDKADPEQVLNVFRSWLEAMEKYRHTTTPHDVLEMLDKIEKMYAPPAESQERELEFRYPEAMSELWLG